VLSVIPILGFLIGLLLGLGFALFAFALWILLMFRAFQGHRWEVPVVGPYAERLLARPAH
jgi:uncharacterized membrane protein